MPQMGKESVMNPYTGLVAQGRPEIVSASASCDEVMGWWRGVRECWHRAGNAVAACSQGDQPTAAGTGAHTTRTHIHTHLGWLQLEVVLQKKGYRQRRELEDALHEVD
jgi:hypothetical protein